MARVTESVNPALGLCNVSKLADEHLERLKGVARHELSLYVDDSLPTVLLLEAAELDNRQVGARYLPDHETAVITPRLDFRGNLHRCVAAHLLNSHDDAAQDLRGKWIHAPDMDLFGGRLNDDGELIAWVAAVAQGRKTLAEWARTNHRVRARVDECETFLRACDIPPRLLPPTPYAFTTELLGQYPEYEVQPGKYEVYLSLPSHNNDSQMKAVSESAAGEIIGGLARDLWIYPESVLGETLRAIYIVEDVRRPRHDIAGYQRGHRQSTSDIVIERVGRSRILFHEVGHALHFRFSDRFPDAEWHSLTPVGDYFGTSGDFIEQGTHVDDYHPSLLARGFITSYSSSEMVEDIAEMMEALFGGDRRLWAAMEDSPVIAGKADLLINFLNSIMPEFDRSFFQQLAGQRHDYEGAWGTV